MKSSFTILLLAASFLFVSCKYLTLLEISEKVVNAPCILASYPAAIVRGYLSTGMVDPNLKSNLAALTAAGVATGTYMNPCVRCGDAAGQVDAIFKATNSDHKYIGVYVFGDQWGKDKQANKKFLFELIKSISSHHSTICFIITSKYHWKNIIGAALIELRLTPMIYVDIDHDDTCTNFDPFGCWLLPFAKKYESDKEVCGQKVGVISLCFSPNEMWGRLMGVHAYTLIIRHESGDTLRSHARTRCLPVYRRHHHIVV